MIDATLGEILVTVEKLRWTLRHGEKALKPSSRPTNLLMMYKKNTVVYEPLGVVAALVSWNYPFHNLLGPMISAIFAGNGIVVKASENTAWSSNYFSLIVKGALAVCGHNTNPGCYYMAPDGQLPDFAPFNLTRHVYRKPTCCQTRRSICRKVFDASCC